MNGIFKPKRLKYRNPFRKGTILMLLLLLFSGIIYSQEKTITGTIVDKDGSPLLGVSVAIKGTTTGTITDIDGSFTLVVPGDDATIVTTYVGYADQQVVVGNRSELKIVMEEIITELDQVVVIGYGTQKKSDLTGSVASVSSEDLVAIPVARIDEALVGRAAGVNVVATSGMPGASRTIQIRGVSSINGFNPLVVIDGIPGRDMNKINPNDIESIEVLKDAASAAIYGASGGNGVILITTKRGKVGKLTTRLNLYTGIQEIPKKIDMMDTRQWNQFYAALNNGRPFMFSEDSLNMNTDWQDEVYRRAPMRNIDLNVSGGTEQITYSIGANYLTMEGMVENTGYDKLLLSMNSTTKITKRIKFDEVIRFSWDNTKGPAEWQYQNVYNNFTTMPTILMVPFLTPYNENENWSVSPVGGNNPFVGIDARSDQTNKNVEVHGNFGLIIDIIDGLTFTSRISGTINNYERWQFQPKYYSWSEDQNPLSRLDQEWRKDYSWTFQNFVSYSKTFYEKHNFSVILGMEASNWWDYNIKGYRLEYASSNLDLLYFDNSLDKSTTGQIVGGSGKEAKSQGYFGRLNYDFNNLLLAQFNYRRDGNSNFGPNNRWGNFYSGSAGFKFSELAVIKNLEFISFGKVRIGYGETGQWPITTYWPYNSSILNTNQMNYSYNDATISTGLGPVQIPNPDLKWETVITSNIGLDLGFMKNQIMLTVDYFNKINEDMIMPQEVSSIAGTYTVTANQQGELGTTGITSTYPTVNYGSVNNKGIETTIEYKKQIGELRINAGFNFTYQKNEITDLATDSTIQGSVHDLSGITISKIGQPIGTYRGYQFDDIFREGDPMVYNNYYRRYVFADQPYRINETGDTLYALPNAQPGDAKWVDVNGDGRYNQEDYVYMGSYIPKFVFGFNIDLAYKGFDFSMFWQGVTGNKIFNGVKRWTYDWQTLTNHASEFADRYHLPIEYNGQIIDEGNQESSLPDVGSVNWGSPSTLYIENGSYLRLRILTVGYTLPNAWTSKVGINRFRVYFTGKNLLTFTKYTAYDPEISNTDPKLAGIDVAGYPQSRMYTLGINLEF